MREPVAVYDRVMELERAAVAQERGLKHQLFAVLALFAGLAAMILAIVLFATGDGELWEIDRSHLLWTLPLSAASWILATVSLLRRERTVAIPVIAIALGILALVLGWVIVIGLVTIAAAIVIALLSQVT